MAWLNRHHGEPGTIASRSTWFSGRAWFVVVASGVAACGVFVTSFWFRFLQPAVNNDFFVHVVRGRQILLGELPVRDFDEPGLPAMSVVSAFAEAVGGHSLLPEVTVSIVFMSLGAVLVFLLATEASRSRFIGLLIAVWTVSMVPRLYSYPKIFLYPLALWVMWRYLDRPGRAGTVIMAVCTALAFLFRHDHGLYIGAAVVVTLILRHWPGGRPHLSRALISFAIVTALLLSPYLLFVQVHGGLGAYLGTGLAFSRNEAARNARVVPAWTYDLRGASRENGLSAPDDPDIDDTQGFDRAAGDPAAPRAEPASRFVLFEGVGTLIASNALPWLFHLFWAMPLAAIGVLVSRRARGAHSVALMPGETEKILVLALLALCVNFGMLRDPLPTRISDVAGIAPIVGAWLTGLAFGGFGSIPRRLQSWWTVGARQVSWRSLARAGKGVGRCAATAAVLIVTCASVWNVEGFQIWLDRTGFDHGVSLARIRTLTSGAYRYLSISPPVDAWAPPGSQGLGGVTRYIRECTTPGDRLFIAGFFPDVHFYSARGFAGGREDFNPDLHSSLRDQRMTVDRLERQSVPIALIKRDLSPAPFVAAYLRQRYRLVPHIDPETAQGLSLFVERRRAPTRVYTPLNTPCYS